MPPPLVLRLEGQSLQVLGNDFITDHAGQDRLDGLTKWPGILGETHDTWAESRARQSRKSSSPRQAWFAGSAAPAGLIINPNEPSTIAPPAARTLNEVDMTGPPFVQPPLVAVITPRAWVRASRCVTHRGLDPLALHHLDATAADSVALIPRIALHRRRAHCPLSAAVSIFGR